MRKTITILLVAVALIFLGGGAAIGALIAVNFSLPFLSTSPTEPKETVVQRPFSTIDVQTDISDVILCLSDNGTCRVVYTDVASVDYDIAVIGDTLTVKRNDTRRWYERIQLFTPETAVTLYLPETGYAALSVATAMGDTTIPANFAFDDATLQSATGDIDCAAAVTGTLSVITDTGDATVRQAIPSSLELRTDTGDAELTEVYAVGTLSARTDTGELTLIDCTADAMILHTDTGDLSLTDCMAVTIATETSTGDQKLTNTIADDRMNMHSDTGEIRLEKCDAYALEIKTTTGDVVGELLTMKNFQGATDTGHVSVPKATAEDVNGVCYTETDTGDIAFSVVGDTVRRDNFD